MPRKSKFSPVQLERLKALWSQDPRDGFKWLIEQEGLPVTVPGLRKIALRDGWKKTDAALQAFEEDQAKRPAGYKRPPAHPPTQTVKRQIAAKKKDPQDQPLDVRDVGASQLTMREEMFVREYLVDYSAKAAAERAGYARTSAVSLLRRKRIKDRIRELTEDRAKRLDIDADALMEIWARQITFDANELIQFRRTCCPFCYSPDGLPLPSLDEFYFKKDKYDYRRLFNPDLPPYPENSRGWWDKSKPPVPTCPNCHGQGVGEIFIPDTRNLSKEARLMYCGVKESKDGIEVLMASKEKAAENLAKALGLFRDREDKTTVNVITGEELAKIYVEKMKNAREREAKMCAERGLDEREKDIVDVATIDEEEKTTGGDSDDGNKQ